MDTPDALVEPDSSEPLQTAGDKLRYQWKRIIRKRPPAQRLRWLKSLEGVAAFAKAPEARKELLRALGRLQQNLAMQVCSSTWFDDVWHHGVLYAPHQPCGCDHCRLRRLWPWVYVGSRGVSFECATEWRVHQWYLLPSSPSGRAIEMLPLLTRIDRRTGIERRGGRLVSSVRMLPESEERLKREIATYLRTGKIASDRRRVNIRPSGLKRRVNP